MNQFSLQTAPQALKASESITVAQDLFADYEFDFFPVTNNGVYIGCVNSEDVETAKLSENIVDLAVNFERFFARDNMSLLEILNLFTENNTSILPVLNQNNEYLGFLEKELLMKNFFNTPFIKEQGDLIIVKKEIINFSMSEVTQIVEGNNAKIWGVIVTEVDSTTVEITLKISVGSLNEIIQSFRRYEYQVITKHKEDSFINELKDRSDYLDKYLSI